MKYIIWSPDKVSQYGMKADTLEELQLIEFENDVSFSSVVDTNDIEGLIEAVHNETNSKLSYALYF